MLLKTRALILKTIKYGDSSLILKAYTEEQGLQSYIISGVRNKRNNGLAGLFQPMAFLDIVAYDKDNNSLNRIKEYNRDLIYQKIPFDIQKGAIGLYMIELLGKTLKVADQNRILYQWIRDTYQFLDHAKEGYNNIHLIFALQLATHLGMNPNNNFGKELTYFDAKEGNFVSEGERSFYSADLTLSKILSNALSTDISNSGNIKISSSQRRALMEKIHMFFAYHIDNFGQMQSHRIFQMALS